MFRPYELMRQHAGTLFFVKGKPIIVIIAHSSVKSTGTRQYQSRQIDSQNKKADMEGGSNQPTKQNNNNSHRNREIKLIKT